MEEITTTPDVEAVVTPAAPVASTSGSETVINTDRTAEQTVPYDRFKEVNTALNEYKTLAEQNASELRAIRQNPGSLFGTPPTPVDDDIDPDVQETLNKWATKNGFVRQDDLDARTRVQSDIASLKTKYNLTDEQITSTREQAVKMGAINSDGLEAAYVFLNQDSIIEDRVKAALATAGVQPTTAERPGPGGALPPAPEERKTGDTKGNILAALRRNISQ